ncbi:MAG: DUF427 domain-containing protein [Geodermatophilaceae bacterium]
MATYVGRALHRLLGDLRVEPTAKRVSAEVDGQTVVSTRRALLVWEPGRVVPQYAVPEADLTGELAPAPEAGDSEPAWVSLPDGTRILPPGPFSQHTAPGQPLTLRVGGTELLGAAFRAEDPDLAGHVILDFTAFDTWYDDDEPLVAHPRDPFTRIDIRPASRQVRIEVAGTVLADSGQPVMLYETFLPVRTYLPRADVRLDLMAPTATRTECAYKGEASYFSYEGRDVCWTYERPLVDSAPITDLICFFDERVDVLVDGVAVPRAPSPWSD